MAIITVTPVEDNKVCATFEAPVSINLFDVLMCKLGIEMNPNTRITHMEIMETPQPTPQQGYDTPTEVKFQCPGGDCEMTVGSTSPEVIFTSVPDGGFGEGRLVLEVSYTTI